MADDPSLTLLARCPLFAGVPPDDLRDVARHLRRRRFRRGEVIFHQGDPGDALHILLSGRVKISSPSTTGVEAILTTLRPGEWFGAQTFGMKPDILTTAKQLSAGFMPIATIMMNQRVYEALGERMRPQIHVLSMQTLTPAEWQALPAPATAHPPHQ